ncbi:MAG TPA: hypothetical protein VH251_05865 [Verrucomicrobiae bacterium]|jgi:hypothetical protein|nr:hypothetical protein [Verrucomicrobiae bacterium]
MKWFVFCLLPALLFFATSNRVMADDGEKIQLLITGGHETDPQDHGRPVILVGNALGVTPEVFREAFSHVKPAPAGEQPDPAQVQRNKAALMHALGPYGVSNELLDRVSNYYRYRPESGKLWPTMPAVVFATLTNGVPAAIVITVPGSGYSSPPKISIPGHPGMFKATLAFGRDVKSNGSLAAITMDDANYPRGQVSGK